MCALKRQWTFGVMINVDDDVDEKNDHGNNYMTDIVFFLLMVMVIRRA